MRAGAAGLALAGGRAAGAPADGARRPDRHAEPGPDPGTGSQLAAVETSRGTQIVVRWFRARAGDIALYAQRVADAWKIGRRNVGDGVLVVVAKNDRRVRIEVAKGLRGDPRPGSEAHIIGEAITPAFKAGDFAGGLRAAVERLDARSGNEGLPEPPDAGQHARRLDPWHDLAIFLFVGAPVALARCCTAMLGPCSGAGTGGRGRRSAGGWFASALVAGLAALVASCSSASCRVGAAPAPCAARRGWRWAVAGWLGSGGGGGFSPVVAATSGGGGLRKLVRSGYAMKPLAGILRHALARRTDAQRALGWGRCRLRALVVAGEKTHTGRIRVRIEAGTALSHHGDGASWHASAPGDVRPAARLGHRAQITAC